MRTLKPSLFVSAALAGIIADAAPAFADHHEGEKNHDHKGKKEKKHKAKHGKKDAAAAKSGDEKIHCLGINGCKGKSECGVDGKHGCAGANACKGQGWITLAKKECLDKKGTIVGGGMPAPAAPAEPAKK